MPSLTSQQLMEIHSDKDFQRKFIKLFSLRILFTKLIYTESFRVSTRVSGSIKLSEVGSELYQNLSGKIENKDDLIFSLFLTFHHHDLLIDVIGTDVDKVELELRAQVENNSILVPWVYDRLLYDRFFELFPENPSSLANLDVIRLLEGTPRGVFQIGTVTIGPFGIIESPDFRYLMPTASIPLWHCADPSCEVFHSVKLKDADTPYSQLLKEIYRLVNDDVSEYYWFFQELINKENHYYDINRVHEMPLLILNSLNEGEIREVVKQLINSDKSLRDRFPKEKKLQGSAMGIVGNLSKSECAQLLLLAEGHAIVKCLEELIDSQIVYIPATEIRKSIMKFSGGFYDVCHQCNALGVRSIARDQNICLVRLVNAIEHVHRTEESRADLQWRLMNYHQETFRETVENYVLHEQPKIVVKNALLYGPRQTQQLLELLYGNFTKPSNETEMDLLIDKVLWKLGFDINLYPQTLQKFWEKLMVFKEITEKCSEAISEREKDTIRSAGVNVFVLLEEVLEKSLCYVTWQLLSDHFLVTKFKFIFEDARDFMCDKLDGKIVGSSDPLKFDKSGNNTLFPLIEGFTALVNTCDEFLQQDRTIFQRSANELPHFHNAAELTTFPFPSSMLLLDIKRKEYDEIKSCLIALHREFAKNNVLSIRNRLEHKERDKKVLGGFPSKDAILVCIGCIEHALRTFEKKGIYPNVYQFRSSSDDLYNRTVYELEDYKGEVKTIKPIPQFVGSKLPSFKGPQLVSSILTISNSSEPLRFQYEEQSEYQKFWRDFPKKRIAKKDSQSSQLETAS